MTNNSSDQKLVILTQASRDSNEYKWLKLKTIIKKIINIEFGSTKPPGHSGVVRSLIEGLKELNIAFTFNPTLQSEISGTVVVLSGHDALKQTIQLKKLNQISQLYAGPNLVVSPLDAKELFESNEINSIITNSDWVRDFYQSQLPKLKNKVIVWPSGVDTKYWKPEKTKQSNKILIYNKRMDSEILTPFLESIKNSGKHYEIINYGEYDHAQFRHQLSTSECVVFFSQSESQGLALHEAWSMNTPTYVWNQGQFSYKNQVYGSSAAPYLNNQCGRFFSKPQELEQLLLTTMQNNFKPRQWVLDNASDKISAEQLMALIKKG
jgi:hypothetical protein